MKTYQSHKRVLAVKLAAIEIERDGSAILAPADGGKPFSVPAGWANGKGGWSQSKGHERYGDDPGYFVQYEDGYTSWSPTEAFEAGYTEVAE